jgi:hypothetical protein
MDFETVMKEIKDSYERPYSVKQAVRKVAGVVPNNKPFTYKNVNLSRLVGPCNLSNDEHKIVVDLLWGYLMRYCCKYKTLGVTKLEDGSYYLFVGKNSFKQHPVKQSVSIAF